MIRIVIADDHELIREGIKKIIRGCADMRIVGEAADLAKTIALVAQHEPDVVVLDISLPEHDGLEGLAKQVAAELGIGVSSVNTYRNRIFRKMGLTSNAALIRYALKSGLVS